MSQSPLPPPLPFADFDFTFDPSLSNLFPNPPPLPSSADLFSPSETTDLLGFLDNFGDFNWDIQNIQVNNPDHAYNDYPQPSQTNPHAPYSNPHLNTTPEPSTSTRLKLNTHLAPSHGNRARNSSSTDDRQVDYDARSASQARSATSDSSSPVVSPSFPSATEPPPPPLLHSSSSSSSSSLPHIHLTGRTKPLLSTPQKRLNHIMSEQKRRNAIRDGYAQLIALLSPAGSAPGIGMPTRGRPKGSGSRGKGQSKGKSGVLFRAVEYCRWLEEGRDALREEILRLETAAGIRYH
ncbi:hypothetical protein AX17_000278 [Amanita inopinata Kibby_2008]|nr:hypothetical protein AX17_000278 [Amanita inopinata Kibby_2008]